MGSSLPPLGALQAFVAVARHLSFSKAAEELHVTPAAVTHQVHNLEHNLGTRLLQRNTRYVALTQTGEACLPELVQALEMLRKDRQVLSQKGVTVYQECKAISADIQRALRTLQSNAASRASQKKGGTGAAGKSF